jgi:hypothetical protein
MQVLVLDLISQHRSRHQVKLMQLGWVITH